MDIEQLKLILDMLAGVGEVAGNVFYVWVGFQLLDTITNFVLPVIGLVLLYKGVTLMIVTIKSGCMTARTLMAVRDTLGIGTTGDISEYECALVIKEVTRLKKE